MKDCDICWLVLRNLHLNYDGVDLKDIAYDFKLAKGIGWSQQKKVLLPIDVESKFKINE